MSEQTELPGYAEAMHSLGSVAAPLLAGFSVTLVAYALTDTAAFRWPNAILALFTGAALALIGCVQCTMNARLYVGQGAAEPRLLPEHRAWARCAGALYNAGILCLLAGVTVALVPPSELPLARLPAIAVGVAGLAVASSWIGAPWILRRGGLRRPR